MNENLRIMLDQVTVAPTETKSEIISIMVSEGCFPSKLYGGGFTAFLIKSFCKLGGKSLLRQAIKNLMLVNEEKTDALFFNLIDEIILEESLSLIQDLLYATHLSKWQFNPNDAKKYLEKILVQTAYPE